MGRQYLKPSWMQRHVGNRLAALFKPSLVHRLSVPGHRTGRAHTVPVVVLDHGSERYLVSARGESDWVRDLRAAGRGTLTIGGRSNDFTAEEVPVGERAALIDAYLARFSRFPHVAANFRDLPDAADHPIFRLRR